MYRFLIIAVFCLVGCKTASPPPPPDSAVRVIAPGVSVNVRDDGRVEVKQAPGASRVNVNVQEQR